MPDTLGLDDIEDADDCLSAAARAFGVRLRWPDLAAVRTAGDLHALLHARMPPPPPGADRCATAMAFHRLRREFARSGHRGRCVPASRLDRGFTRQPARRLLANLARSGLRVPRRGLGRTGLAGLALILLAPALLPVPWFAAGLLTTGMALYHLDPGYLPEDCATAGGLARRLAGLNADTLAAAGARRRPADTWAALVEILASETARSRTTITPATLLSTRPFPAA